MANNLSIQDKLLISALAIEEGGKERFSAEDLVVMGWRKFPEAFGLAGYVDERGSPLYPNSNRIYAEIMGSKPLRKNGLIRKVGSKMYQLTEIGRLRAKSLGAIKTKNSVEKWALAREQIEFIRKLLDSKAAKKYREDKKGDISFFDACGFWGISAASNAKDLWSRFAEIENILIIVGKSISGKNSVQFKHGGDEFSPNDLKSLVEIHIFLQEKFQGEIEHIKKRIDERKQ
jgi:DNA-binding PadR family transcriptional regulator